MTATRATAHVAKGTRPVGRRIGRQWHWIGLLPVLLACIAVGGTAQTASATTPFTIKTTPALAPAFKTTISEYAVRCSGSATTTINTTGTGTVTIGGKSYAQPASVKAALVVNQAVYISGGGHSYTIRCLPADFPTYKSTVEGTPQAHGYLVTPGGGTPGSGTGEYVAAFDNHGVPVWWYQDTSRPFNAAFYGTGQIGWWTGTLSSSGTGNGVYTIRDLTGAVKTTVTNPTASLGLDEHDFQLLPNGDYLDMEIVNTTADLSSWGDSSTAPVLDNVLIEITPAGQVVWSWDALQHINVAAENVNWRSMAPDVMHMNSFEQVGSHLIVSFRHLDAVYDIDKTTGNIIWKLGGTTTPQSLTVSGNTNPQVFSGQHDARQLGDGSITVHDNASQESGVSSRAIRFQINTGTNTATVVEDVTDKYHPGSAVCCGSANRLSGGNWLISWGNGNYVTELNPSGTAQIDINYWPYTSYRAAAVPDSDITLSHGMDARFPPLHL